MIIPAGLATRLEALFPGAVITEVVPLKADSGTGEAQKGLGYGRPLRVRLRLADGTARALVFHLEGADDHGHDRRADRAGNVLLAWDSFPRSDAALSGATSNSRSDASLSGATSSPRLPHHARALDVGGITASGALLPLGEVGELYLLTEWADGQVYADDLRRIGASGVLEPLDLARLDALVEVMHEVHAAPGTHPGAYVRSLRDLVGSGEGIAGIVDSSGEGSRRRLDAIEQQCLTWRQRLKYDTGRLRRIHGDFHPFNLVFAPGQSNPTLLDTSRGSQGDPADDVTCLGINFLFFGLEHRELWKPGLGRLWSRFWERALAGGDGVLEVAAPFLAWRVLVLCNPTWYPHLREVDRDRLLRLAERALASPRFDPAWGPQVMS